MKNQAVTTICGLITGNQLHIYLLLFGLSTTTSQHMWLHFFTFESYGLYEVEQGSKQLRAQLASWFYAIIGIEKDGIFVSDGVQFHISCLQRKIHHDSYMVTFPLIVLVVRASMLRQLLLKPVL
ncbi:putative LL-diaminopimelate aminotransferase [Helianthus debilis subsp. tardiflorus]